MLEFCYPSGANLCIEYELYRNVINNKLICTFVNTVLWHGELKNMLFFNYSQKKNLTNTSQGSKIRSES